MWYLNFLFRHIGASSGKMSDFERDKIDSDAATLMQTCSEAIKTLKNDSKLLNITKIIFIVQLYKIFGPDMYNKPLCMVIIEMR